MHENKYLHLPVVDEDKAFVVGVVNVMEIVQATAGAKGSSRCACVFPRVKRVKSVSQICIIYALAS